MRKTITRAITATTIKSANVSFEGGQVVTKDNEPIIVNGVMSVEKALKAARKTYGEYAQVTDMTTVDDVYEISVEDFIKHATKVVPPVEQK